MLIDSYGSIKRNSDDNTVTITIEITFDDIPGEPEAAFHVTEIVKDLLIEAEKYEY